MSATEEALSVDDLQTLWHENRPTVYPLKDKAVQAFLTSIGEVFGNGGAKMACFTLSDSTSAKWASLRKSGYDLDFVRTLLQSSVAELALGIATKDEYRNHGEWEFQSTDAYTFDGVLTQILVQGGAYNRFAGPARAAKQLCSGLCDALFDDRYEDVQLYFSYEPWSDWFRDVAWDYTFVGFDATTKRVWVLCMTDTD